MPNQPAEPNNVNDTGANDATAPGANDGTAGNQQDDAVMPEGNSL